MNPISVLVLRDEVQEARQLVALAPEVRVEERVVALASAPEHVVLAAEPLGDLEHVLDLGRGVGEHLRVRVGRGAGLVARVGEQVGRAPQQTDAGPFLVAGGVVGERVEVRPELRVAAPLGRHVAIVEAVVGDADLGEELEGDGHLRPRGRHLVAAAAEPRTIHGPGAEHVHARPGEGVPEADARPEVVLHALPEDEPIGLVDLEREWVGRLEPAEGDRPRHLGEEVLAHEPNPSCAALDQPSRIPATHCPRVYRSFVREEHKPGRGCGREVERSPRSGVGPVGPARHAERPCRRRRARPKNRAMPLSSRERVLTAINHEVPDRVPIVIGVSNATGIKMSPYRELKGVIGVDAPDAYLYDWPELGTAAIDEATMRRLHGDVRGVLDLEPAANLERNRTRDPHSDYINSWGSGAVEIAPGDWFPMVEPLADATTIDEIERYPWPNVDDPTRFAHMGAEAARLAADGEYAIMVTPWLLFPLERAFAMQGMDRFLMNAALEREFAEALLRKIASLCERLMDHVLDAVGDNIDIVKIGDDLGTQQSLLMSPAMYRSMLKPIHAEFIASIRRRTRAKVFFHTDGDVFPLLDDLVEIGVWTSSTPSRPRPGRWPTSRPSSDATAARSCSAAASIRSGCSRWELQMTCAVRSDGSSASWRPAAATCSPPSTRS